MSTIILPLTVLHPHPANSNVMSPAALKKLTAHLARTDRYPPVIVRPMPDQTYQILDGHHRVAALRSIDRATVRCDIWEVDDAEALILLATLNRLQGQDDPRKRAALIAALRQQHGLSLTALARQLPEDARALEQLETYHAPPPSPRPPQPIEQMPQAVLFFLLPQQRTALEARLAQVGPTREQALLHLVCVARDPAPNLIPQLTAKEHAPCPIL
ncbi:MAG: ParB/RepB/Spo0J family partition protein [Phycisphaeraceae bacterium]